MSKSRKIGRGFFTGGEDLKKGNEDAELDGKLNNRPRTDEPRVDFTPQA